MSGNNSKAIYAGRNGSVLVNEALKTRDLFINGDVEARDGGKIVLNALTQKSSISANTSISSGGTIELGLGNGAFWNVVGDSHVSSLTALGNDSHVFLTYESDKRNTLVIDELKGESQLTFVLHTDLKGKDAINANDRVVIKSASSGNHAIYIPSSGEAESNVESSYLVYAPDSVSIQLDEKHHTNQLVDKGLYLYKLTSEKVAAPEEAYSLTREAAPSYNGYYLTLATDNPNDSGDTENPGNSGKPVTPLLSPTAKAVLAMAGMGGQNAMYHNQLSDLRKRLGEVRGMAESNGLWVSASGQRDRFDGFASNGVKQNAYRFNLGLDHKIGSWLIGANFKYLHGTQKTSNPDSHSKGKVNSAGANIYGTWIAENGLYTDIVASFDHYHQKITTSMLDGRGVSGKVNNFGLGLSAEVGKKFGLTKDFFVEPQAQLAYYWIKGKDFSMSNGMKVEQDDFNSLVGRLGVVAGKDFKDAEGNTKGQVFVKGGVKQQFAGKQKLRANSVQFKDELKGTSGYYGLGFEANPNKKVSLYGHVERENGKHYTKEIEVMLGLRYKF
ncbi:autotransporter outer membrane beta-barrel domain-containing protein [Parasutterella sp.]